MKKIAILGSTGSIGRQTLDVAREQKDIEVVALCARRSVDLMEKQIVQQKEMILSLLPVHDRINLAGTKTS